MQPVHDSETVAHLLIQRAQERAANPGRLWGLSWGDDLPTLNQVTGGIEKKKLVVLISRPNAGKSALAAKVALNVARQGNLVRIATYEMSAASYQHRIACFMSNVPIWRIDKGQASADELARYAAAQGELAGLSIEYQESSETFEEMRDFFGRNGGCDFGILDHIGLVPGFYGSGGYSNASSVSIAVSKLAHTLCTLLVLGHQNRQSLQGEDKRPTPESVAGSDQVTRDADLILGIFRPDQFIREPAEVYDPNKVVPGELLVLKNRSGPMGMTIHLLYAPTRTDWRENAELNGGKKVKRE